MLHSMKMPIQTQIVSSRAATLIFMLTDREGVVIAPLTACKGFVGLNEAAFRAVFLNILFDNLIKENKRDFVCYLYTSVCAYSCRLEAGNNEETHVFHIDEALSLSVLEVFKRKRRSKS